MSVETLSAPVDRTEPSEPQKVRLIHKARSDSQADIWLVEWNGKTCVLRDYTRPRSLPYRWVCRWAMRREIRVHRLLKGVEGIPKLVEVLDKERYLIEFIDGKTLAALGKTPPGPEFFEKLTCLLDEMHRHGVAHGDLRNKNIMVGNDGLPYLIDFSTAWWQTAWWRKPLYRSYLFQDRRRLAKSKAKLCPETLSPKEREILGQRPLYIRFGYFYRHRIYPLLRRNPASKTKF